MKRVILMGATLLLGGCRGDSAEQPEAAAAKNGAAMPASESTATLKVGDSAPAFSLADGSGQTVSLADTHASGPAVLVFYRGDW